MADLSELLTAVGATDAEIEQATTEGTALALLADRFLLPGERKYDLAEAATEAGAPVAEVARLWRALGFPQAADGRKLFTDDDVAIFRTVVADSSMSDAFFHEARLLSGGLTRVAEVLIDEMWDDHVGAGGPDAAIGDIAAAGIDIPRIERILLHILRRQLVAATYRRATVHQPPGTESGPLVAVGFADLVGFTALSQRVGPSELARLVMRFEEVAYDLVAEAGGRVVKTIGDEVMFSCRDPQAAAHVAIELATGLPDGLPDVRASVAWGPVLIREGDCFGPTVNLASRIVGAAQPCQVLVSNETRDALAADESFRLRALPEVELKDFGPVPLWEVTAADAAPPTAP